MCYSLYFREVFELATDAQANRFAAKGDTARVDQVLEALVSQDSKLKGALATGQISTF